MNEDSKVESLLTPGIRKWREDITKQGRITVDKNLENHSRRSYDTLMNAMGKYGLRKIANEFFICRYCAEFGPTRVSMKIDRHGNLTCRYHENTVFLTNKKISEIAFGLKEAHHQANVGLGKLDFPKKKRQHGVRGHWRTLESGKTVWVRAHDRGNLRE